MKLGLTAWISATGIAALLVLSAPASAQAAEPTFLLKEVRTPASDYLSEADIKAVTSAYTGQRITFRDIQLMVASVQKLYAEAGVPTAHVILPPQEIRDGVLQLGLVEAEIEEVRVVNNAQTHAPFLTQNISAAAGEKPDFTVIEQDLRVFALAHDIRPTLEFRPGQAAGSTVLIIDPQEGERFTWSGTLDNYGRKDTGRIRAGLNMRIASVTGWRDTVQGSLSGTEGSWQGNLLYDRPIGPKGGHGYVGAYVTNSSVIGGTMSSADVLSDGQGAFIGYRFPFQVKHDRSLSLSLGATWDNTKSSVAGVQFADTTLREINAQVGFQRQMPLMQIAGTVSLHLGDARNARSSAGEGGYTILKASGTMNRMLGTDLGLSLDVNAQISPDEDLPVARQFSVGGSAALRGYPSDVRAARSGVMVRAQFNKLKPVETGLGKVTFQPFGFVDAALLVPYRRGMSNVQSEDKLISVGLGGQFSVTRSVGLTASVGVPLRDTNSFKGKGDPEVYLGLSAKF